MSHKRIHVTLSKDVLDDPAALADVVEKVQATADMTDVNERRLKRYGVLSGLAAEERIGKIRGLPGVDAVNEDEVRKTSH